MKQLNQRDLAAGLRRVWLPDALERKYPTAAGAWAWPWVFPSAVVSIDRRSAGQYQESFWLGFFTEGSEFKGSSNPESNADLTFNEIAIKISEKLKHADANGGEVDLSTVEEVLEITQGVSQKDRETIAQKPANNDARTTGYHNHQTSDDQISKPRGLELPPIDL